MQGAIARGQEGVVVLAAFLQRALKAGADLKALGGRQRHHRLGQIGFQLVEYRHAEPHGGLTHHALDHAAAGIAIAADRLNPLDHLLRHRGIRAAHDVGLHIVELHRARIDRGFQGVNALHPGDHFGAMGLGQQLFGNRTGGNTADRFPGGGAATATARLDAVFGLIGRVSVGGSEGHLHLLVVLGALILVAHHHGDWGAEGHAVEQPAEDLNAVVFFARGGDLALAGFAPVQFRLNRLEIELKPWRAAIHDHTHPTAMGFTEGADAEEIAEAAAHGLNALQRAYKLGSD